MVDEMLSRRAARLYWHVKLVVTSGKEAAAPSLHHAMDHAMVMNMSGNGKSIRGLAEIQSRLHNVAEDEASPTLSMTTDHAPREAEKSTIRVSLGLSVLGIVKQANGEVSRV